MPIALQREDKDTEKADKTILMASNYLHGRARMVLGATSWRLQLHYVALAGIVLDLVTGLGSGGGAKRDRFRRTKNWLWLGQ